MSAFAEEEMSISPVTNANLSNATSNAIGGLQRAEQRLGNTAQNIANGSLDPKDVVDLRLEANLFKANTKVLKTTDEISKSLLDVVA